LLVSKAIYKVKEFLLFTDTGNYYLTTIRYLWLFLYAQAQSRRANGIHFLELVDLSSMMIMTLWHLFNEVFGKGMADMKNPKSNVEYLMESLFYKNNRS
jgi:hypothetical protein